MGKLSLSILIQILFAFNFLFAQDASTKIITKIDTTNIKVGEQVNLEIKIESTDLSNIVFPEKFNFSPIIIAEEFPLDTISFQRNKSISKKFKLTLFDEGSYFIKPPLCGHLPTHICLPLTINGDVPGTHFTFLEYKVSPTI